MEGMKGTSCRPVCNGKVGNAACGGPNHGTCTKPETCTCKPGWGKLDCKARSVAATCSELQQSAGAATLYVGNRKDQPYKATCGVGKGGSFVTKMNGFEVMKTGPDYLIVKGPGFNGVYGCQGKNNASATVKLAAGTPFKVKDLGNCTHVSGICLLKPCLATGQLEKQFARDGL